MPHRVALETNSRLQEGSGLRQQQTVSLDVLAASVASKLPRCLSRGGWTQQRSISRDACIFSRLNLIDIIRTALPQYFVGGTGLETACRRDTMLHSHNSKPLSVQMHLPATDSTLRNKARNRFPTSPRNALHPREGQDIRGA